MGRHLIPIAQRNKTVPLPPVQIPDCPPGLDGIAREQWDYITQLLAAEGLISRLDRAIVEAYCRTYARWRHADDQVTATGEVVANASGTPVVSPWARVRDTAAKQLIAIAQELGLSASSRAKIKIPGWAAPDDLTPAERAKARFFIAGDISRIPARGHYPDPDVIDADQGTNDKSRFIAE